MGEARNETQLVVEGRPRVSVKPLQQGLYDNEMAHVTCTGYNSDGTFNSSLVINAHYNIKNENEFTEYGTLVNKQ